uniref:Histidinol-phosphate aminotransferase NikK-like protein n=1 Tax=Prochloron didemni P3-Solomon TaxID=910458 RepID=G0XS86_PRODI|nr:histidinol-phosphate aminotransferase NikK-like protein [Prochloron didemni P3-Solomon]
MKVTGNLVIKSNSCICIEQKIIMQTKSKVFPEVNIQNFLCDHVLEMPIYRKYRSMKFVNLANNELHHSKIDNLQEEVLKHLSASVCSSYPSWPNFADRIGREYSLPNSQILITAGSDDAYKLLTKSLFSSAGMIVTQWPNYSLLLTYAHLHNIPVKSVSHDLQDGFSMENLSSFKKTVLSQ